MRQVADAFAASAVVALVDEGGDGGLGLAFKEIVFEQNLIFHGLLPPCDLSLRLRMGFWTTLAYHFGASASVLPFIERHIGVVALVLLVLALIGLALGYRHVRAGPKP